MSSRCVLSSLTTWFCFNEYKISRIIFNVSTIIFLFISSKPYDTSVIGLYCYKNKLIKFKAINRTKRNNIVYPYIYVVMETALSSNMLEHVYLWSSLNPVYCSPQSNDENNEKQNVFSIGVKNIKKANINVSDLKCYISDNVAILITFVNKVFNKTVSFNGLLLD